MKVLLFNGSPNENGCTDAALRHMSKVLTERNDIKPRYFRSAEE